jgi:hypothetical protein
MKQLLVLSAFAFIAHLSWAQESGEALRERQRIATQRKAAEDAYTAQEKACYRKFAVTDCLNEARARRRAVISDLRRQEVALNDAQRKQRAADHLEELDRKKAREGESRAVEERAQSVEQQKARESRAAEKTAERAQNSASDAARAAQARATQQRKQSELEQSRASREKAAAANVARRVQNEKDAAAHKAEVAKREAEKTKKPASSLPTPP